MTSKVYRLALSRAVSILLVCVALPRYAHADEYRMTFFAQHGNAPTAVEMDNGGEFYASIDISSTQVITIPRDEFSEEIDSFFVTASYQNNKTQSFEFRLLRPSPGARVQEKSIFLSEPERFLGGNYVQAVVESRQLLRRDRRKAFVPFFQCRESYFKALDLGDKQTALESMECWIVSSHRVVFADPRATRRMFAPDPVIFEEFTSIQENIANADPSWISGLNASRISRNDLATQATQVAEMRLSNWLHFKTVRDRAQQKREDSVCKALKNFRGAVSKLSESDAKLLMGDRFEIDFEPVDQINLASSGTKLCASSTEL